VYRRFVRVGQLLALAFSQAVTLGLEAVIGTPEIQRLAPPPYDSAGSQPIAAS
jgi:hypothetical protein